MKPTMIIHPDHTIITYGYAYTTENGKTRDRTIVRVGDVGTTIVSDLRGNRLSNNAPGKGIGKIASVWHETDVECEYVYDTLGRISNRRVYDGNASYDHLYAYDSLGRLRYLTYPDGFRIKNNYSIYGEFISVRDDSNDSLIYCVSIRNEFRQPLKCRFGNMHDNKIIYERWIGSELGYLVYREEGNIVNDTSFVLTEINRIKQGEKTETKPIDQTYYFKNFLQNPTAPMFLFHETQNHSTGRASLRDADGSTAFPTESASLREAASRRDAL